MTTELFTDDEIRKLVAPKFVTAGITDGDVGRILEHLLRAEKRGYPSHGLVRVPSIVASIEGSREPGSRRPLVDLPGFLLFDGAGSQGIATVCHALELAVERSRTAGAIVVGATNYRGTTGCLGVYAADLARDGYATILMCHSEYGVAPVGAAKAILGTNPITMGMPAARFPFVGDVSTAAWSYGALKQAMLENRTIPEGIVQTADGRPSKDPNDADNGSQLPMAGHKGYALGLGIELLCGPLLGGKAGKDAVSGSDSFLGIVIRGDVARTRDNVVNDVESLFNEIRTAPLADGYSEVRIPGERSNSEEAKEGKIRVRTDILAQIKAI